MSEYDIELRNADLAHRKSIIELEAIDTKVDQTEMATEVCEALKNANESDTTLLGFMRSALEQIGVNCESNSVAANELATLLINSDIDEEGLFKQIAEIRLGGLIMKVLGNINMLKTYGAKLTTEVAKAKQIKIGDKFWDGRLNVGRDEWYSFDQFKSFVTGYTKCVSAISNSGGLIDKALVDKVQSAMSGIGVKLTDDGVVEHTAKYIPSNDETLKNLGWDSNAAKSAIKIMDDLAKALTSLDGLKAKAEASIKKAREATRNTELSDKDKVEVNKAIDEFKASAKFMAKFINGTIHKSWTFNVKMFCDDALFVVSSYDSSKYKEPKK